MAVTIHACKSAAHPTTAIVGVTHFGDSVNTIKSTDPGGGGNPGLVEEIVADRSIAVTLFGTDPTALYSLVEAAAANLVVTYKGVAGADKTITYKSVVFNDPPSVSVPRKDAGGSVPTCSITGRCAWGNSDTFAAMIVYN